MILIISALFPPEPVVSANLSHDLAIDLSKSDKVTVLCPRPTRPEGYRFEKIHHSDSPFEKVILDSYTCPKSQLIGRMRESYSFGRHSARFIRRNKKQISGIYVNSWPLLSQLMIVRMARRFSIPVILHIQDIYPESLFRRSSAVTNLLFKLLLPVDKFILRKSSQVITISEGMKRHLVATRAIPDSAVQVVYNWSENGTFKDLVGGIRNSEVDTRFTFMFLGSLSPSADLVRMIKGFSSFKEKNARLVIAGNGSMKSTLQNLVSELQDRRIEFIDAPAEKAREILNSADALILSLQKGAGRFALPSKLSSYMLARKPILGIIDKNSDSSLVIEEAQCGWMTSPDNTTGVVELFEKAYNTPEKSRISLGENGYKYAVSHFSKETNLAVLHRIIKNSIN